MSNAASLSSSTSSVTIAYLIDNIWCDIHGIYIQGWAHAFEKPVRRLIFSCGGEKVYFEEFSERPDLLNHYPEHPCVVKTGFSIYLNFPPFFPVQIEVVTDKGSALIALAVPDHLKAGPSQNQEPPLGAFLDSMRARKGTVLEIGARVVGDMTQSTAAQLGPECTFIGFDIHPALGVDVVGDAHTLTQFVPRASVDGIFSVAVLEHLQAPWLAAAEMNRALRPDGRVLHVVPQTWPVHETPNDFWRMSDEGLKTLFGPSLGFEIIDAGMCDPFTIIPNRRVGSWTSMPLSPGYGTSYVYARKIFEIDDDVVVWPLSGKAIEERAQLYPRHETN
ncbi:methyltransferase domain-containing protein [Pararhodospirillum photometricum]|uniref:methyltransferase domain-containing protein n=1 Tax=Pararhodospirillum photometricum TaxID=1084 RepID=UPI0012FEF361|nr:class I SAM-dependent methyltransferase [Pararhodospirillum photometricum]